MHALLVYITVALCLFSLSESSLSRKPSKESKSKESPEERKVTRPRNRNATAAAHMRKINKAVMECCEEQQVEEECMDFCAYDANIALERIACRYECADAAKKIIYCLANKQDNRKCCAQRNVTQDECMYLCDGDVVLPSYEYIHSGGIERILAFLHCGSLMTTTRECFIDNHVGKDMTDSFKENDWSEEQPHQEMLDVVIAMCNKLPQNDL